MIIDTRICPICGAEYTLQNNRNQLYCSKACKLQKRNRLRKAQYQEKKQAPKPFEEWSEKEKAEYRTHIINYAEEQKRKTIEMIWGK